MTIKRFAAPLMATPLVLMTVPAFAGNVSDPVVEPVITPVAIAPVEEWTGFYLGGQVGYGDASAPGVGFDGGSYGVHAGYLHDLGNWVIGGELDYDKADFGADNGTAAEIDQVSRLKFIAGYDLGRSMVYGTVGAFNANLAAGGVDTDDNGALIGIGMKYKFTDNVIGGVEALYHDANDFGGVAGNDLSARTITARISYQF